MATAVCLTMSRDGVGQALGAALAASVLVGSIVVEPFVARAARFKVPLAVRLPGLPTRRERRDLGWLAVICSVGATAVGLLGSVLGAPAWLWAVVAVVAVLPVLVAAIDGRAKVLFARRLRTQLPDAVARYQPEFVVYTSRPDDASYQVMMWLPYLQRAGRAVHDHRPEQRRRPRCSPACTDDAGRRGAADRRPRLRSCVPSLRAAFYVNASSGNGALVRYQHLTHVYLGHGDSDKPPSYNPTHAMYDQIFAAGPAAVRRYAAHGVSIPAEKFRIVGRPQVEDVVPMSTPISSISGTDGAVRADLARATSRRRCSTRCRPASRIVAALLARGATVIFRPHPFSYDFGEDAATIAQDQGAAGGRCPPDRTAASVGRRGGDRTRHLRLHQRLRRDDLRRLERGLGLSVLARSRSPWSPCRRSPRRSSPSSRWPGPRTSSAATWPIWTSRLDQMLGADPLARSAPGSGSTIWATSRLRATRRRSSTPCGT